MKARYLEEGERYGRLSQVFEAGTPISYVIAPVKLPDLTASDKVILTIFNETDACKLVDGNPLSLKTLGGYGTLNLVDLETGARGEILLQPGSETTVNPGEGYWYEKISEEPLVVEDICPDFNPDHEISVPKAELLGWVDPQA
jgi:hypothetical protein